MPPLTHHVMASEFFSALAIMKILKKMIKDPKVAKQVSELILEYGKKLDLSLKLVLKNCRK
jgi:hypothetical protein